MVVRIASFALRATAAILLLHCVVLSLIPALFFLAGYLAWAGAFYLEEKE